LESMLLTLGHEIEVASNDRMAVRRLDRGGVDAILSIADPSEVDALELLTYARRKCPTVPVLLLFTRALPDRSREASRLSASAILRYPLPATELRAALSQALESSSARPADVPDSSSPSASSVTGRYPTTPSGGGPRPNEPLPMDSGRDLIRLVGEDPGLKQAVDLASAMATKRNPVLIVGERGVGKTLLARALHAQSPWKDRAFIEVSCGSLTSAQLERELLGHRVGGANGEAGTFRPGALSLAQGGTIFLDEVETLSPYLQDQLLRVIRDGEFVPVHSTQPIKVDVRIVMASREDLNTLVQQGLFRQDLYYRLGVCLRVPPLRHRGKDIEILAEYFRSKFAGEYGRPVVGFTTEALDRLRRYDWPGNVQELEYLVQRAVSTCQTTRITVADLDANLTPHPLSKPPLTPLMIPRPPSGRPAGVRIRPLKEALEEPEKQIIIEALQALSWNRQETARVLDINRTTLYKKMKKYGLLIDEPAWAE
jgi:two-component system response regulator HydG